MNGYFLPPNAENLVAPHFSRNLLLDTNLLLLFILGSLDPSLVGKRSLNKFEFRDYLALQVICANFKSILTTPHILTEVCHIGGKDVGSQRRTQFYSALLTYSNVARERSVVMSHLALPLLVKLGLADAVTHELCLTSEHVLLSVDFELCNVVQAKRLHVVNFNHIRDLLYE